jgi:DNA-binding response OmpR family regulator
MHPPEPDTANVTQILYIGRRRGFAEEFDKAVLQHQSIERLLHRSNRQVRLQIVTSQRAAWAFIKKTLPNIVLIELGSKTRSRQSFCETLRYRLPRVVILGIHHHNTPYRFKFDGLMQLPLNLTQAYELLIQNIVGRGDGVIQRGHIHLDLATRTLTTADGSHSMTPKQCALLHLLLQQHGETLHRTAIMQEIWDTSFVEDTRTLDVHVRWLRERIEPNPSKPIYLLTVRGIGYRLSVD